MQNFKSNNGVVSELKSSATLVSLPASRNSNYIVINGGTGVLLPSTDDIPLVDLTSARITVKSGNALTYLNNQGEVESRKNKLKHVTSPFKTKIPREQPSSTSFQKNKNAGNFAETQLSVPGIKETVHNVKKQVAETAAPASFQNVVKDTVSTAKKVLVDDIEQGKIKSELQSTLIKFATPFVIQSDVNKTNQESSVPTRTMKKSHHCGSDFAARWLWSCLGPYKIPLVIFVIMYVLVVTCGASLLLKRTFVIPGLRTQINRLEGDIISLETQVDRFTIQVDALEVNVRNLTGQVDRLEIQNNRFSAENVKLAANNAEYAQLNSQLNANNKEYKALNGALNTTVENYRSLNEQLHRENDRYQSLNEQLNQSVLVFSSQVTSLQEVRDNLTTSVSSFQNLTNLLQSEVGSFSQQNAALNGTVAMLQDIKNALEANNEYYRQLNANLSTVVSFLNSTASFIGESFDSIVSYLAHTIVVNRNLVLQQLYLAMRQVVLNWRCGITDTFLEPWVSATATPIGINSYRDVLSYVNTTVLSKLCISLPDFELFLANRLAFLTAPSDISLSQLSSGVNVYTTATLKYYFPSQGGVGLTDINWDKANFKCSELPGELRFSLYGQR